MPIALRPLAGELKMGKGRPSRTPCMPSSASANSSSRPSSDGHPVGKCRHLPHSDMDSHQRLSMSRLWYPGEWRVESSAAKGERARTKERHLKGKKLGDYFSPVQQGLSYFPPVLGTIVSLSIHLHADFYAHRYMHRHIATQLKREH